MTTSQEPKTKKRRWRVTRRGFLLGAGATAGTLAIGVLAGRRPFYRFLAGQLDNASAPGGPAEDPIAWFEISPDNDISIFINRVEMGQGVHTSMAQIGAEELGIDFEQLTVVQAGTQKGAEPAAVTGGSNTISSAYLPLRKAAAAMREMLIIQAAGMLGAPAADLEAVSATVRSKSDADQSLTYGEIVAATTEWPELQEEPVLKEASEFQIIGRSIPRVDFEAKLTGQPVYGYDLKTEGMLYGAVIRPPTIEATLLSVNAGSAAERDGVVEVVVDEELGFAGVVATTRAAAWTAVNSLDVEWDEGHLWSQEELDDMLDFDMLDGYVIQKEGNALRVIDGEPTLAAEYRTPMAVHAHLEPQAAMADFQDGKLKIWTSTQGQGTVKGQIVAVLGMEEADVEVVPTYLGGGFGRRLNANVALEAALLARAVGRPVHVGWTRQEEMRHGYVRPSTRSQLSAKLNNNRIEALSHRQASGEVAFPFFPGFLQAIFGTDFGAWRGSFNFYEGIPNRQLGAYLARMPIKTGWWRGLGLMSNIFATESFMDEMAHAAGVDPLEFRLAHLSDDPFSQRMRGVLEAAAERAGYGESLPEGRAFGVACGPDVDTVVAMISEISVDDDGFITVHKVTQAIDAGLFINPDGAKAQAQGSIIMGLSSTLIEELTVSEGRVVPNNFDRYPLLTIDRAPEIEIVLLESDLQPRGMGEPPMGPVAASVANALFNLTGKRIRQLPLTPERVRAA
ncbi:MAG: molybdopterin-dependent oxidoreductase [Ardenticatenaceae bacterium]|nr:molybdopterin-dependent oxidoreductase [Ardenticatenaceae bacterium]